MRSLRLRRSRELKHCQIYLLRELSTKYRLLIQLFGLPVQGLAWDRWLFEELEGPFRFDLFAARCGCVPYSLGRPLQGLTPTFAGTFHRDRIDFRLPDLLTPPEAPEHLPNIVLKPCCRLPPLIILLADPAESLARISPDIVASTPTTATTPRQSWVTKDVPLIHVPRFSDR